LSRDASLELLESPGTEVNTGQAATKRAVADAHGDLYAFDTAGDEDDLDRLIALSFITQHDLHKVNIFF